jgi:hypothetical protein
MTQTAAKRLPGRDVLDMPINAEPRGLLGRFFLRGDQLLRDAGLTPRIAGPKELLDVNEANRASWPPLLPNMDLRTFPPGPDDILSVICYSKDGEAVATVASRRYDMRGTTLKAEADSLRFYYGPRADEMRKSITFDITAPSAAHTTGLVSYLAALWVRPDHRKIGATRIMFKLCRYMSYAQWPYDYDVLGSLWDISPPHVRISYSPEGIERGFTHSIDGKLAYEGYWVWTSRAHLLQTLADDVAAAEAVSKLGHIGRDQQELSARPLKRH